MTRLDSAIDRLRAQRDCLKMAAERIDDVAGVVLELGLGNGRTYDHLRALLPEREIFVFERELAAHPDCVPPRERLLLGDLSDTLPRALERIGRAAALVHADIGCGVAAIDRRLAALLARHLPALTAAGGVVVCDQPLSCRSLAPLALPATVRAGRYHLYHRVDDAARPAAAPDGR